MPNSPLMPTLSSSSASHDTFAALRGARWQWHKHRGHAVAPDAATHGAVRPHPSFSARSHVSQEKRTKDGKPNTGSTLPAIHALVTGSEG